MVFKVPFFVLWRGSTFPLLRDPRTTQSPVRLCSRSSSTRPSPNSKTQCQTPSPYPPQQTSHTTRPNGGITIANGAAPPARYTHRTSKYSSVCAPFRRSHLQPPALQIGRSVPACSHPYRRIGLVLDPQCVPAGLPDAIPLCRLSFNTDHDRRRSLSERGHLSNSTTRARAARSRQCCRLQDLHGLTVVTRTGHCPIYLV